VSRPDALTPTSFALLGLLAVRRWTTYELARQMDRTFSRFWPRARSKLYEEPKKLVALGLATAQPGVTGRRPRTVYEITPAGRRELAGWLARSCDGPVIESEQLVRLFFAEHGTTSDALRTLDDLREWVHARTLVDVDVGRSYLDGSGPFPERAAVTAVVGRCLDDLLETFDRWAAWATGVIEAWPEDPHGAELDRAALAATVAQAEARAARWQATEPRHRRPAPP
jgi:PadR family transcriptional regulator AphA